MKLLVFLFAIIFSGCSLFQSSEKQETVQGNDDEVEEVYVFDEVSPDEDTGASEEDIKALEKEIDNSMNKKTEEVDVFGEPTQNDDISQANSFFLQLGAFSSLKRAEEFVSKIESQVSFKLSIIYNSLTSFYNVRSSAYSTKQQVEHIRDDFWSKNLFKDAFIVTE